MTFKDYFLNVALIIGRDFDTGGLDEALTDPGFQETQVFSDIMLLMNKNWEDMVSPETTAAIVAEKLKIPRNPIH